MSAISSNPGTQNGRVWTVGALVLAASDVLGARFGQCTVRGELAAYTQASSGHHYFSLKDAHGVSALIRCAMFRRAAAGLSFAPREGLQVELRGRLAIFEPRGDLQFIVESMQAVGAGNLYEQFLKLKAKLQEQGLFDAARKRPLPSFPTKIGVVSSLSAAALHDVLTTIARRAPHVDVVVYPSPVQGAEAPAGLVSALRLAAQRREVDALILARGGGSMEDLWSFNDERVVQAVAASPMPLVCGVGHETDVTLCDFAADVRAATPTAAAELLTPDQQAELQSLRQVQERARTAMQRQLDRQNQHLDQLALMVMRPAQMLSQETQRLMRLEAALIGGLKEPLQQQAQALALRAQRLSQGYERQHMRLGADLQALAHRIQAQDPREVLKRGYAWLSDEHDQALLSAQAVKVGQQIRVTLQDGRLAAVVERRLDS